MVKIVDFGDIHSILYAHSSDENIRFKASSGGFIKSFLVYLLESEIVDLVIVTRTGDSHNPLIPETIITNSIEDILSTRTNSVYAVNNPLHILNRIDSIKKYAFVGLPCHVRNLKAMQRNGKYRNITMVISLFCNHTPNMEFTRGILEKLNVQEVDVKQIEYRGNGWPGGFTAYLKNGQKKFISSKKYWSNDLNNGPEMCKYCSEIGVDADVCVGDPWNLDLEILDKKGLSLVICRNSRTHELIRSAAELDYIKIKDCIEKELIQSQGEYIEEKRRRGARKIHNTKLLEQFNKMKKSREFSPSFLLCYLGCKVVFIRDLLRSLLIRVFRNHILIWYWREEKKDINFGDYLSVVLLKKFGYKSVKYHYAKLLKILDKYDFCLLVIGSELHKNCVDESDVRKLYIWGQGKGRGEFFDIEKEPYVNKVKIFAVRGPHTIRQLNLSTKTPIGDPGFLLPLFFKIKRDPSKYKITYIPHHTNRDEANIKMREVGAERYVDIMCSRRAFWSKLKEIISSSFVLTNSLHAAIICHAYGVPWALCLAKGHKLNMPDKWKDFFEFLNIEDQGKAVRNYVEGQKWWEDVGSNAKIRDLLPLLESFPLPIKDKKVLEIIERMRSS